MRAEAAQGVRAGSQGFNLAFALVLSAVAAAGVASLLYEVLWVRQLSLSLGSTVYATSIMLSAFLGGLAIGSWYASRRADSLPSPLLALAKVEVAAGVIGAFAVPVLGLTGRAYVFLASELTPSTAAAMVIRLLLSLIVMLLPATLFGVAFPLAVTAASRLTLKASATSGVYAASSFGSALGAALGGLFLEPTFGLTASALVGAGINFTAAAMAFAAHRASGPQSQPQQHGRNVRDGTGKKGPRRDAQRRGHGKR